MPGYGDAPEKKRRISVVVANELNFKLSPAMTMTYNSKI